ncbi:MAG: hypothetical protein QM820_28245 [Minicystis sp.]
MPAAAYGQSPSPQAEALFNEGRAALQKGDYATACPRFAESFDRSGALGPLLNLAECEERRGRLATALARWKQGVTRLEDKPKDSRLALARERVASLEKRAPRLSIALDAAAAAGVGARLDDQPIKTLPAADLPVDPGQHRISFTAPGHPEQSTTVTLAEGEKKSVTIGTFPEADARRTAPDGSGSRRVAGFVVGGIGVAGLAVFGITGALMFGKRATVREHCVEATKECNDATGLDAAAAGQTLGRVNAVALGLGLAGLGVGTILIATSRGGAGPVAAVSGAVLPGGGGISLQTTF